MKKTTIYWTAIPQSFNYFEFFTSLTLDRKKRINNLKVHSKKNQKVAASLFLTYILGKVYNLSDFNLKNENNGKPYIEKWSNHISISHSHNIIGIGISTVSIGIDIEQKRNLRTVTQFMNNVEYEELHKNMNEYNSLYWTQKESFIKLLGQSLDSLDLKNIKITYKEKDIFKLFYNNRIAYVNSFSVENCYFSICSDLENMNLNEKYIPFDEIKTYINKSANLQ